MDRVRGRRLPTLGKGKPMSIASDLVLYSTSDHYSGTDTLHGTLCWRVNRV